VLGNSGTALFEVGREGSGGRGTGTQPVEDGAPRGVGDGSEHVLVSLSAVH
jgi:hypothetical protein